MPFNLPPGVSGVPIPGYLARIVIGGLFLNADKFDHDETGDVKESTNFESIGPDGAFYANWFASKKQAKLSFAAVWAADMPPHAPIPNIRACAVLSNVYAFVDKTSLARAYYYPQLICSRAKGGQDANGHARVEAEFVCNGYWVAAQ
jgi:hypothetical protein